jgi:hypothetical protein
MDLDS